MDNEHDASLIDCKLCQKKAHKKSQKTNSGHFSCKRDSKRGFNKEYSENSIHSLPEDGTQSSEFKYQPLMKNKVKSSQFFIKKLSPGNDSSMKPSPSSLSPSQLITMQSPIVSKLDRSESPSEISNESKFETLNHNSVQSFPKELVLDNTEINMSYNPGCSQFLDDMDHAELIHEYWHCLANETIHHKRHQEEALCSGLQTDICGETASVEVGHISLDYIAPTTGHSHLFNGLEVCNLNDSITEQHLTSSQLLKDDLLTNANSVKLNTSRLPQSSSCPDIRHNMVSDTEQLIHRSFSSNHREYLGQDLSKRHPLKHWSTKNSLPQMKSAESIDSVTFEDDLEIPIMLIDDDMTVKKDPNLEFKPLAISIPILWSQYLENSFTANTTSSQSYFNACRSYSDSEMNSTERNNFISDHVVNIDSISITEPGCKTDSNQSDTSKLNGKVFTKMNADDLLIKSSSHKSIKPSDDQMQGKESIVSLEKLQAQAILNQFEIQH